MLIDHLPIRVRLSLSHALWMVAIFASIGIGVYRLVEDNIIQTLDATLMHSAKTIRDYEIRSTSRHGSQYWNRLLDEFFGYEKGPIKTYAQLLDTSGNIQAKTKNIQVRLPVSRYALSQAEVGQESFETFILQNGVVLRQLTIPIVRRGNFTGELVQVGTSMQEAQRTLKSVERMLWITLGLGLLMSVIVGDLLTKRSLRPVARVTSAVAALGVNHNFDKRLKVPPAVDEMSKLIKTFNEMIDRLEDAFLRLRRFSGNVSHELRTPIAVMQGEAQLALRRERTPEEYKAALTAVVKESRVMSAIVEDLLLLARAEGRSLTLERTSIEVDLFLKNLVSSVRNELDQKDIKVNLINNGKNTIDIQENYYSLALKNLLLNACRHSENNSCIDIEVTSTYNETRFDITDFGEGIPPKSLPYIFDAFYRADTARNRKSGGAGIGLSLAKALIELHGGTLTVESTLGQGTTFRATLAHPNQLKPFTSSRRKPIEIVHSERLPPTP